MGSPSGAALRCLGCVPATRGEVGSAAESPWQQSWARFGGVLGGIAPLKHVPRPSKVPAIRRVRTAWGRDLPPSKLLICPCRALSLCPNHPYGLIAAANPLPSLLLPENLGDVAWCN